MAAVSGRVRRGPVCVGGGGRGLQGQVGEVGKGKGEEGGTTRAEGAGTKGTGRGDGGKGLENGDGGGWGSGRARERGLKGGF